MPLIIRIGLAPAGWVVRCGEEVGAMDIPRAMVVCRSEESAERVAALIAALADGDRLDKVIAGIVGAAPREKMGG